MFSMFCINYEILSNKMALFNLQIQPCVLCLRIYVGRKARRHGLVVKADGS
jgi:hypothetical protein